MDACDGPMPGEEPLPPPEKPVVVKDNTHTKAPTTDRAILAQCIEELAIQVKCALDNDSINNKRYARRMRLENRIRHTEGKGREDYPIVLPIAFNSWNDVNIEELEYRIIMAVNNQDNKHVWYHVRILFDDFIDPQTKDYLEQLDRGEDLSYEEAIPQLGPSPSNQQSSHSNTPLASSSTRSSNCQSSHSNTPVASTTPARSRNHQSTHNSPVTSTSKSSPQPSTSTSSSAPSSSAPSSSAPKKMRAPVVTIDVEGSDDEDIMILN